MAFLGALSTDLFGQMLAADLAAHGIDTAHAPRIEAPTTLAFVDIQAGEPRYAFFNEGTATRRVAPDPAAFAPGPGDVVDMGSISLIDLPGADAIAAFAEGVAGRARIALDPNARPGMTPDPDAWRARIARILKVADIVRLSIEDLAVLAPGQTPAAFAESQLAKGSSVVVVTHGPEGAEGWTAAGHVRLPGHRVSVVDTVGAGDTLMGTLLAQLALGGHSLPGALERLTAEDLGKTLSHAVAAAALNCRASGCCPPRSDAVAAFLAAQAG